jgi:hypothetical protein
MVVIGRVPNSNNDQTSSMQLQASYPDIRHWEELINFIEKHCCLKVPYCLTAMYTCNLMQKESDEEYMGLYAPGHLMNDLVYGRISYHSSLSNAFKLKQEHIVKPFLVEMKAATGKNIAEHVLRPAKVIPASLVMVSCAPLQISIIRLRSYPMKMKEWWMKRPQEGKRLTVVLM